MSQALDSPVARFSGRPQDVEVLTDGAWRPGQLLGWRHDASGRCQAWVRIGPEPHPVWRDLALLRLPGWTPEDGAGEDTRPLRVRAVPDPRARRGRRAAGDHRRGARTSSRSPTRTTSTTSNRGRRTAGGSRPGARATRTRSGCGVPSTS